MKTIVELYDSCQLENVIAALKYNPEKIIFIGFKEESAQKGLNAIKAFFSLRTSSVKTEYVEVKRYDYDDVIQKLNEIIDTEPDCVFDLTGGKELVLVAMGAVSAKRNVPMIQIDIPKNSVKKIDNCESISEGNEAVISVRESFALNGGEIISSERSEPIGEQFAEDIKTIWNVARRNLSAWNNGVVDLTTLEKNYTLFEDRTDVTINLRADGCKPCYEFINKLKVADLIQDYKRGNGSFSYSYKNERVKECISKSGNILELYTYLAAQEISAEEKGYFDGIESGVKVDWNRDSLASNAVKTVNEIDVVMMRDTVPVFVSCKGGKATKEALYELNTVANRLGGKHSLKILVTTGIANRETSRRQFLKRARDMKITVINNVHDLEFCDFKNRLIDATDFKA